MLKSYVYSIGRRHSSVCKIGMTKNVESRLLTLQTGSAEELVILYKSQLLSRPAADLAERTCHYLLDKARIGGEWFSISHDASIAALTSAVELVTSDFPECDFDVMMNQTKHQTQP